MKIEIITTKELLEIALLNKKKFVEARLILNGFFATHFLFFTGKHLYDEGIDGEERRTTFAEFQDRYPNCHWILDQVVE